MDNRTIQSFLALGDSYTIGEGVTEQERWPNMLAADLRALGHELSDPMIIARTGWTTSELKAGILAAEVQGPFDLVSLLIGVNNQYRGPGRGYTQEGYRQEFADLLDMAIAFADGDPDKVVVVSIPDYSVTPFVGQADKARVAREIDAYNAINAEVSGAAGARYVDITPVSREAAGDKTLLASDNLHPSGKMYALWTELIRPVVVEKKP